MEIKPIKTEEDHAGTLAEVERLWEAEPGSEEADRLDVLTTLIEAYEEKNHPILPPDPMHEGLGIPADVLIQLGT